VTDPKILSGMELPFPVGERGGKPVVGQGKEERISVTDMGKGIECDMETPTQEKGGDLSEDFFLPHDQKRNGKCTPDHKGMDGPGNERIPKHVPERIVHPFQKTPIGKNPRDKRNHINQIGEKTSHTYFPCPRFSIKEGKVPEKMFVRAHGICLLKCRFEFPCSLQYFNIHPVSKYRVNPFFEFFLLLETSKNPKLDFEPCFGLTSDFIYCSPWHKRIVL